MIRLLAAGLLLFSFTPSFAVDGKETYFLAESGKRVPIQIRIWNGVRISQDCQEERVCQALEAVRRFKHALPRGVAGELDAQGFAKNPASAACSQLGGMSVILADAKLNQFDFCRFSDRSLVSSGDILLRAK